MKKVMGILASSLMVLAILAAIVLSLLVIWEVINPTLALQIEETIWLGLSVMIVSFIIHCALE